VGAEVSECCPLGGGKGIRTPDPLHAIDPRRVSANLLELRIHATTDLCRPSSSSGSGAVRKNC
jgi:hypothetical protein